MTFLPSTKGTDAHRPLSVDKCRELMQWKHATDAEIAEFLTGLRSFLSKFLDEHFDDSL